MTPPEPASLVETHSAVVVFFGDRAYKVKKPVDLGFLDFRSRAAREAVCHREVELNRRLAPDVYLGVSDVLDPDGEVCDHLVVMRRMPVERRLSQPRRGRRRPRPGDPADRAPGGHPPRPIRAHRDRGRGRDRRRHTSSVAGQHPEPPRAHAPTSWTRRSSTRSRRSPTGTSTVVVALFEQRIADGRAVDGHGDLLADDIFCLDDGPRILDCIEFDDALRLGDGLADAAFLAMDLEHLGRPDLARRLLDAYREATADVWPSSLEHHHVAYRAQVRAKVAAIRAAQGDRPSVGRRPPAPRTGSCAPGRRPRAARAGRRAARHREVHPRGGPRTRARDVRHPVRRAPQGLRSRSVVDAGRDGLLPRPLRPCGHRARPTSGCEARRRSRSSLGESVVLDASWSDPDQRAPGPRARHVLARRHPGDPMRATGGGRDRAPSLAPVRRWRRIGRHPGDRRAHGGSGRAVARGTRRRLDGRVDRPRSGGRADRRCPSHTGSAREGQVSGTSQVTSVPPVELRESVQDPAEPFGARGHVRQPVAPGRVVGRAGRRRRRRRAAAAGPRSTVTSTSACDAWA